MRRHIAILHKDADSDYGGSFPDLPGCASAGAMIDAARVLAAEASALHLEGMAQDGEAIPPPSSREAVMARDGVAVLVSTPHQGPRAVRVNTSLPEDALREIDARAASNGFTRSVFLANAARKALAS